MEEEAVYAFLCAFAVSTVLTPAVARLAVRVGAVDPVRERGLAREATPLLGGLAMLAGVLTAGAIFLPAAPELRAILGACALITAVGALDDLLDLHPALKLAGQIAAAAVLVLSDVRVEAATLPFLGRLEFGEVGGGAATLVGIVLVMNVVNFSDGVDGLAAGVCAIAAAAFAVIAFDLGEDGAGVLAAITVGAALGFLFHNFHPASVFMGDAGSNLLGLLMAAIAVEGSVKTNALIALFVPLVVLAVPFLDTGFVVAKRIKYRRPVYRADSNHFHHRLARIGFSQRRTVAYLYAWTFTMAALAVALRFVPYSDSGGRLNAGWAAVMGVLFVVALAASVYLVYVLEILKLRRFRAQQEPQTAEHVIDARVAADLETGEFPVLR